MTEQKKEKKSIFKILMEYDRRIIYLLIFILVLAPLLAPFSLPIEVSSTTQTYYDVINTLKPGDNVLVILALELSAYNELQGGLVASCRMFFEHEVNLCIVAATPEAVAIPSLVIDQLKDVMTEHHYVIGQNYIDLGYVLPNEPSVVALAQDFHSVVRQDASGKSIQGTFLDKVNTWKDWRLLSQYYSGASGGGSHVIQHFGLRGTPMIFDVIGATINTYMPYLNTGLVKALLGSTRGGAELEYLIGKPGSGLMAMNSFSIGTYFVLVLIILGNIGYYGYKYERKREGVSVNQNEVV